MIQFCNRAIYADLTVAAKRLKFISTNVFNGGIMMLSDDQVQACIYEHVKAKSADDFIQKIRRVRFRVPGKEENFTPDAASTPELLNGATYFTHVFRRTMELITQYCDPAFIPPLYKEGKTTGLIDYYLAAWPNDSGNTLYARLSVSTPSLRVAKTFPEFTDLFLEKIEPLTKIKQDYDDVNAMLRRRHERPEKPTSGLNQQVFGKDRQKRFDKNKPRQFLKRDEVHMQYDDEQLDENEAMGDLFDVMAQMMQRDDIEDEGEEQEHDIDQPQHDQEVEAPLVMDELNAFNAPKPGAVKEGPPPCWWKFMKGECTKDGCRLDHSERAMQELRDKKLRELATAKYGPKPTEVMPSFTRYANQKPSDAGANKRA